MFTKSTDFLSVRINLKETKVPVTMGPPNPDSLELLRAANPDALIPTVVRDHRWNPGKAGAYYVQLCEDVAAQARGISSDAFYCLWPVTFQPANGDMLSDFGVLTGRIMGLNGTRFTVTQTGNVLVIDDAVYYKDNGCTVEDVAQLKLESVIRTEIDCDIPGIGPVLIVTPLTGEMLPQLYVDSQHIVGANIEVSESLALGGLDPTTYDFDVAVPGTDTTYHVTLSAEACMVNDHQIADYENFDPKAFDYRFSRDGSTVVIEAVTF